MKITNERYSRRRFVTAASTAGILGVAGCMGGGNGSGGGGDFPSRDIEVVVGYGAGGGTDTLHRGLARPAENILNERGANVSININNITGAASLNAASYVLGQPADGYTIWGNTNGIARNIVDGRANFSIGDWQPLMQVQHDTSWMFTSGQEGTGVDSIEGLINRMESGEETLIGVVGAPESAVFALQWTSALGLLDGYTLVTYNDAGRMGSDVISGEIHAGIGEIQELNEQYEAGGVSLILVGVEEPLDDFPDVPTVAEIGAPDATFGVRRGVVLPNGVSQERVDYLHDLYREAMESESYQQLAQKTLVTLRQGYLPPDEYEAAIRDLIDTYERAIELVDQVQSG